MYLFWSKVVSVASAFLEGNWTDRLAQPVYIHIVLIFCIWGLWDNLTFLTYKFGTFSNIRCWQIFKVDIFYVESVWTFPTEVSEILLENGFVQCVHSVTQSGELRCHNWNNYWFFRFVTRGVFKFLQSYWNCDPQKFHLTLGFWVHKGIIFMQLLSSYPSNIFESCW